MTVDYPDYATPQAHASAIAVTGAPLLTLGGTLLTSTTFTLAGGQAQATAALPITQLGYEVQVKLSTGSTATVPFVDVTMQWSDGAGNNVVAQEKWMLPCGSAANYVMTGSGPTKGGSLVVKLANQDPAVTATVTVVVLVNSRVYTRDRWVANAIVTVPGFTLPGGDPLRDILATIDGVVVTPGTSISRLFPPYAGDVMVYAEQVGVGAANSAAKLQVAPTSVFSTGDLYSSAPTGGVGTGVSTIVRLPRACTLFNFNNSGTVNATVTAKAVMLDDRY